MQECCCEIQKEIGGVKLQNMELNYQGQIRDLQEHYHIEKEIGELKCGQKAILEHITNTSLKEKLECKEDEIARLRAAVERQHDEALARGINCKTAEWGGFNACLTNSIGNANREFN